MRRALNLGFDIAVVGFRIVLYGGLSDYNTIFQLASGEVNSQEFDVVVERKSDLDVVRPDVAKPVATLALLHLVDDVVTDHIETLRLSEGMNESLLGKVVKV